MRVGPMTPDRARGVAVDRRRRDQAERAEIRGRVLGADDDRQAGAVDVLVEQVHQALFLFHHLQQRAQRGPRHAVVRIVEQRQPRLRRGTPAAPAASSSVCCASRSARRQQLVVQRALLLQPRQHRFAHVEQPQAGEFGVQVVRRLHQILRPQLFAGVDDLLRDLVAARDDDDQHAAAAERARTRSAGGSPPWLSASANPTCRAARDTRCDTLVSRSSMSGERPACCADLVLDAERRARRLAALEQQIDEHPVAAIGRHASGRGVRLVHVAELFELSQHVPHRRRRHAKAALAREHLRRHRLAGLDVLAHQRGQQAARPIGELRKEPIGCQKVRAQSIIAQLFAARLPRPASAPLPRSPRHPGAAARHPSPGSRRPPSSA